MKTDVPVDERTQRDNAWYSRTPASVAEMLGVDPARALTAAAAAERLRVNGPNALPEEKPKPGWLAFLEHGLHEHAGDARQRDETEMGRISSMLAAMAKEKSPLTKELDRLTSWIAAAAGLTTMVVMFVLGRSRGEAWDVPFVSAVALAVGAVPAAVPTVTQWILSVGRVDLAKRSAIVGDRRSWTRGGAREELRWRNTRATTRHHGGAMMPRRIR